MKEIKIPFEQFKFEEFIKDMVAFIGTVRNPDYAVAYIEKVGDMPEYDEENKNRNYLTELKEEGKLLYIAFSGTNCDDPIDCANGKHYYNDEESEDCEECVEDEETCFFGEGECIGYLLQYVDGELIINSACEAMGVMCMLPPSIDIQEDCELFDKPMEAFIKSYIG